jgi:hypothetical protein
LTDYGYPRLHGACFESLCDRYARLCDLSKPPYDSHVSTLIFARCAAIFMSSGRGEMRGKEHVQAQKCHGVKKCGEYGFVHFFGDRFEILARKEEP